MNGVAYNIPKGVLNSDYQIVVDIHDRIMSNLDRPMPAVEQLAKEANMSKTKFRNIFQKIFGSPIYQYHLAARLELSKKLLLQNNFTITQISYKVGFSHPPAFVTCFFKHFGFFPSTFREQIYQNGSLQSSIQDSRV